METIKQIIQVDRKEINYLRTTLESYDGLAVVRTIDPQVACLEIMIAPGCEDLTFGLLDSLEKVEGLKIKRIESQNSEP
jgi:hypothetical protein